MCHDPEGLLDFLETHEYPLVEQHREHLKDCASLAITDSGGDVVGYIWASWLPDCDNVLNVHSWVVPEFKGRWVQRKMIRDFFVWCRLFGANHVSASPIYSDMGDQLERLGFVKTTIGYLYKL